MAIAPADLSGLPSLGNFPVSPYEGLQQISTEYGLGPQFGGVDYIAARQAGYNDAEIIAFLKANPQLDTNNVSGRLAAGQGPAIIQGALGNISGSDPNRAAIANPNQAPSVPVGATLGTGGQDWVPVANNVNINVQGNQDYASMMYANSRGTLDVAAQGGGEDGNSYFIFDSATGKIFAGITPVQSANGYTAYQFSYPNPNSRGTISEYVIANDSTGIVSPINTNSQLAYTPGAGGGFLAQSGLLDLFSKALPIASIVFPGLGFGAQVAEALGLSSALGVSTAVANQIGSALINVAKDVAMGSPIQTALQNAAVGALVNTGSQQLANNIISAGQNPAINAAISSGVASAGTNALSGGNSDTILTSAIVGAASGAAKASATPTPAPALTPAQVSAANTGTTTDVTAPTTGTIPSSSTNLSLPPGVPAGAALETDKNGNPVYIDYASGVAYDQAGNKVPGLYLAITTGSEAISQPSSQTPAASTVSANQGFFDKYGTLFSFGTNDPLATKLTAIYGTGASGGQPGSGTFQIFAFDSPQQQQEAIIYLQQAQQQINADPNATAADKATIQSIVSDVTQAPITPQTNITEQPAPTQPTQPQQGANTAQPSPQPSGQPDSTVGSQAPSSGLSNAGVAAQQPTTVSLTPGSSISQSLNANLPIMNIGKLSDLGPPEIPSSPDFSGTASGTNTTGGSGTTSSSGGSTQGTQASGTGQSQTGTTGTGNGGPGTGLGFFGPGSQGTGTGFYGTTGMGVSGPGGSGLSGPGGYGPGGIGLGGTGTGGNGTETGDTTTPIQSPTVFSVGQGQVLNPQQRGSTSATASSAALAQALNLGNLGDPFFTKTGKKPKYVWNEASLRTGNETGVQSG